jgi:hypothetical protein
MMQTKLFKQFFGLAILMVLLACGKQSSGGGGGSTPIPPAALLLNETWFDNTLTSASNVQISRTVQIKLRFSAAIDRSTVVNGISLTDLSGALVNTNIVYESKDSVLLISPVSALKGLSLYSLKLGKGLQSTIKTSLASDIYTSFNTVIDPSNKFPLLTDEELMDKVQKQGFAYFWDFAHPVSGLARERSNGSSETVTSGGSGFGIMAIPMAINRNFISRAQGLAKMQTIVAFLKNKAQKFHGAFPHWLNGTDGTAIAFSTKDDGADLVETSYLMAGLLTARQYFNGLDNAETALRADINVLWNGVEWNWFRQNSQQVLYWHWSPKYNFEMNLKIQGWNECLITYILAASANTDSIPVSVYHNGFARNGAMKNGNAFLGINLPLGTAYGGPLFFSHYSFLGINPIGLSDVYANYQTQVTNHSKINYAYCVANPKGFAGYGTNCWGLTASDISNGYTASSPTNDVGVIAPTAAISSFPFTPTESMNALKFFYYQLGDKIFKEYGFVDAFSMQQLWFANSTLAIDKGPELIMMENYRSQLIWNLLTSTPEIKRGMKRMGFVAPYL